MYLQRKNNFIVLCDTLLMALSSECSDSTLVCQMDLLPIYQNVQQCPPDLLTAIGNLTIWHNFCYWVLLQYNMSFTTIVDGFLGANSRFGLISARSSQLSSQIYQKYLVALGHQEWNCARYRSTPWSSIVQNLRQRGLTLKRNLPGCMSARTVFHIS